LFEALQTIDTGRNDVIAVTNNNRFAGDRPGTGVVTDDDDARTLPWPHRQPLLDGPTPRTGLVCHYAPRMSAWERTRQRRDAIFTLNAATLRRGRRPSFPDARKGSVNCSSPTFPSAFVHVDYAHVGAGAAKSDLAPHLGRVGAARSGNVRVLVV
jgi:hypothetical protein